MTDATATAILTDLAGDLPAPPDPIPLAECLDVFRRYLYLPDTGHVVLTLAAVVANRMPGDPVWLLVVGPPSTGKTEVIAGIAGLPEVRVAATLTEAALLSGVPKKEAERGGGKGGLLRTIPNPGVLVLKDFTSILAQNVDTRGAVLAALREIYDGSWTRHVGTDGGRTLHWSGKVGLIGGCTPAIDRHHGVIAALGDRFIQYRLPDVDPIAQGDAALDNVGREAEMRTAVADACEAVIAGADPDRARGLDDDEKRRLNRLASLAVRARSAVDRDPRTKDVLAVPQPEGPARFLGGLRRILTALDAIGCDRDTTWQLLTRLATDSMPTDRRRLCEALVARDGREDGTGALAAETELPTSTARRALEDLALLRLAGRRKTGTADNSPDAWKASPLLADLWPPSASHIRDPLYNPQPHNNTDMGRTGGAS